MASKGPRPKPDHESRAKRQKAVEIPREPRRPKTHWDHVLEEMLWLSKDFESERKWKLALAKRVALRASKGMVDQATRGEKKLKEEEQRLKKVALNISKDVKKFWLKIEKLVLYKHQMEIDVKKKKALDKQLEFLLGQTERYSTMLAENLVDDFKPVQKDPVGDHSSIRNKDADEDNDSDSPELNAGIQSDAPSDSANTGEDSYNQSEDESEDDEQTIEEDEARITKEERQEELDALQNEIDLPLEELLKRYTKDTRKNMALVTEASEDNMENVPVNEENELVITDSNHVNVSELATAKKTKDSNSTTLTGRRCDKSNGTVRNLENHLPEVVAGENENLKEVSEEIAKQPPAYDFDEEGEDGDFILAATEEKDDEATLSEEEEFAKADPNNPTDEIALLQKESEIPIEELLARYKKDTGSDEDFNEEDNDGSDYASALSDGFADSPSTNEPPGVTMEEDVDQKQNSDSTDPGQHQRVSHSPTEEESNHGTTSGGGRESEDIIADAAAAARSAQPTGNTLSTTKVRTKVPFFLKFPLREYQHIGLDWLVTMYEKRLNGILADEMGLGKTIMTIALLAHLACEKGIWGPHLIVVPTSVMLNWETEFLKWCPAFKILTYFGSAKERKLKRQGWLKPNSFHVCITTYRLVIQDSKIFKRKKWKYLILDEAHLIKNWKSQRWQTLLNFNSKRRILLTGTPLQNDLMELWSLMHFLMPHVFQSHQEFKDWFCNPITGMVEGQEKVNKEVVDRLHNVLRPFLLRRLKRDVEKQLPMKKEHVIYCRLSRRQRNLYEDFIASSETQATLSSANFFAMISVIMQLRKVCNHPDLFEGRPIVSSFDMPGIETQLCSSLCSILEPEPFSKVDLIDLGLLFTHLDYSMNSWESDEVKALAIPSNSIQTLAEKCKLEEIGVGDKNSKANGSNIFEKIRRAIMEERLREAKERSEAIAWWNSIRCERKPVYSTTLRALVTVVSPVEDIHRHKANPISYIYSTKLADVILSPVERFQKTVDLVEGFMFAIPAARAPPPIGWCSKSGSSVFLHPNYKSKCTKLLSPLASPFRPAIIRRQVYFPDRRLIQFDCGKLQELAILLRRLKYEGHRALIFTQMTKMLDVLEAFINLYGYTYMRLDGSTPPEERQTLMQRFNTNPKIFLFILSTRSGGVGINLVGADTVIFYDSDWNPAMDQQAQDRCHRIGQTREVHIYRLISESTIEENILKKANQKRALDDLVIQSGGYNTEFFKKLDPMELFTGHRSMKYIHKENEVSPSNDDVEAALKHAEDEADYMALKKVEQEEEVENQEFTEEAIGRGEDDEIANEDDPKVDELANQSVENGFMANESNAAIEEKALVVANIEDDSDMLADVKQMAEAAIASGQEVSSFENQLRPIDRYAVRFLELWDPIIDKAAVETQVRYEEAEWELDRLEKYKEEMEADIDEDEEPFVYETWDADFATEAYRQQVEVLTQHQLMEEQEYEARLREEEAANDRMKNDRPIYQKPKSKKKQKKAKFKSLKKGSLASESKSVKEEQSLDAMSEDDDTNTILSLSDSPSPRSFAPKKRKKPELTINSDEENTSKKKPKKSKKTPVRICSLELDTDFPIMLSENHVELEQKPAGKSKMGGKISITSMPIKRVLMIKPEKLKKGSIWSRDCVPSADVWLPQEDAILCAVVHEYGPHWNLVSDTLYGMTAGGFYRGRYRHPVHCCERYRELIQRYVLSAPDNPNCEKVGSSGSGKALLKVTEENVRALLDIASEQPDTELLLQRHITALLSSVWKVSHRGTNERSKKLSSSRRSLNSINQTSRIPGPAERITFPNPAKCSRLVKAMLHEVGTLRNDDYASSSSSSTFGCLEDSLANAECLELTLEFPRESDDSIDPIPSAMNLSVTGLDSRPVSIGEDDNEDRFRSSCDVAENRFRASARACADDNHGWAFSVFPTNDLRSRSAPKLPSLGKHKLALLDLNKPSKATKFKRASPESSEPSIFWSPTRENLNIFPPASPFSSDVQIDDIFSDVDHLINQETEPVEMVDHIYVPSCIFDLDDCPLSPDLTDIG